MVQTTSAGGRQCPPSHGVQPNCQQGARPPMSMSPDSDRRVAKRHIFECPLEFRSGQGMTRNLSSHGILFSTLEPFGPRQRFAFTLQPYNALPVHCLAEVLRAERQADHYDVAALLMVVTADMPVPGID